MTHEEKKRIFKQLGWDYKISPDDIESVLKGKKASAGHFSRETLFIRMLETYPWFTIVQVFTAEEIKSLLTRKVVTRLRSESLRKKYEFVRDRLQQIIPAASTPGSGLTCPLCETDSRRFPAWPCKLPGGKQDSY